MRLRLTLWFVFGVVLIAVAGAAATYAVLGQQLRGDLDSKLVQQLNRYEGVIDSVPDISTLAIDTETFLSGSQSNPLRQGGYVFALQTSDGTVISNSGEIRLEDLPETQLLLRSAKPYLRDVTIKGQSWRVAGTPIMLGDEQVGAVEIAASLSSIGDTLRQLLLLLAVGGSLGCLVVGVGSWFLVGRALGPVRRITRTAAAITHEDLSRRIGYSGRKDEIGELALTMDAMLDRLQSAFSAQEQFISDASHELRTPLTIMKGHLQVLDRVESPDPVFVKQEHGLVLDELDRMNRLVGDLLTLARATRLDFLRKESLEVDGFLQSLAGQGTYLGDRVWRVDSLPGGTVKADQDRLTQVFLNLMQNAVRHTAEGQVVALGGTRTTAGVSLWVRDEGEGMSRETLAHVFERFYRGAGERDAGAGLGLSIVKAIVEAHDGRVSAESQQGAGARFTVTLPL